MHLQESLLASLGHSLEAVRESHVAWLTQHAASFGAPCAIAEHYVDGLLVVTQTGAAWRVTFAGETVTRTPVRVSTESVATATESVLASLRSGVVDGASVRRLLTALHMEQTSADRTVAEVTAQLRNAVTWAEAAPDRAETTAPGVSLRESLRSLAARLRAQMTGLRADVGTDAANVTEAYLLSALAVADTICAVESDANRFAETRSLLAVIKPALAGTVLTYTSLLE